MKLHYKHKSLRTFFALTLFLIVCAGCAGHQAYTRGQRAEVSRDYETAMEQYRIASQQDPGNVDYRLKYEQARFAAAFAHFENGRRAMANNDLATAKTEFTRAVEIDPSHALAAQELERINNATSNQSPNAPPPQLNFEDLRNSTRTDPTVQSQLDLKVTGKISLQMTQNTRTAYESLAEIAGLNVIFDPDFRGTPIPIELTNVDIYEALDILSLQARSFWKPLNRNTIVVSPDNQTKRREYEEHILKTIYLTNSVSSTEITEAITAIRTLLNMRYVAQSSAMNAIIIRDTPDRIAIAEKIIEDIDKSKPEVLVEAVIMEVDRNELRDLGIAPPTDLGYTAGIGSTATTTPLNIRDLDGLNSGSFSLAIPQAVARALATSGHNNLIQNPSVRASDGKLASIKIGSQLPVPSGSFQPAFAGATGTPVVQYQYINVGVNLDITPRVLLTREISLVVNVVVSALAGNRDVGGILLPVLTNRSVQHEIRLKEGETNILGGIIQDTNSTTITGLPILNKIPLLKYLFGQERKTSDQTEIIIMLTPHIIRMPQLTDENMRGLRIGVETKERITPDEGSTAVPAPPAAIAPPVPGQPGQPIVAQPTVRPTDAAVTFSPSPVTLQAGAPNIVNLALTGTGIAGADITLSFDPSSVKFRDVQDGGFLSRDGQVIAIVQKIETESGTARISVDRQPGAPPVGGNGNLLSLLLEPGARKGDSVIRVIDFRLRDAQQNVLIGRQAEVRVSVP